jgi:hypothetical protein
MDELKDWYKIVLPSKALGLDDIERQLLQTIQQRDHKGGFIPDVALFKRTEYSDDLASANVVYYLSPVAASISLMLLPEFKAISCPKPANADGIQLLYGSTEGSVSWDLLK